MTEDWYYLGYNGTLIEVTTLNDDAEYEHMVELIRKGEEFVTFLSYSTCDHEPEDWQFDPRHVPAHRWSKIRDVIQGRVTPSGYTTLKPTDERSLRQFGLPIRT